MSKRPVIYDSGGGITELSIEFFSKHFHEIGKVFRVTSSFDGRIFNTELEGDRGVMLLSGLSCGYTGTAPKGLHEILQLLGWIGEFRDIMSTDLFEVNL